MLTHVLLTVSLAASALSVALPEKQQNPVWNVGNFDSLVTFGDSYTDENHLSSIIQNNFTLPPAGTYFPEGLNTASGGRTWPRFAVEYTGNRVELYDYAVSGAVCSNNITPRNLSTEGSGFLFPAVLEYEVPAFLADRGTNRNGTDQTYFSTALSASNAVYSIWIGTNDLGVGLFLTDAQIRGYTLPDYVECIYRVFDELYAAGGRFFVLFNNAPLNLAPLYANDTLMGVGDNQYWDPKPENHTVIAEKMHEYVTSTNAIFKYKSLYEALVAKRYPGANLAVFDVWQLLSDIYDNPTAYLNGTQPANVTGFEHHCTPDQSECTLMYNGTSSDSFMWYDELHPSEQTDRIIARTFLDVLNGNSTYAQYY
ncbi:hypothetical protein PMZ80_001392 [Knufia obscura]|uniref:Uncharacterized protein n=1 Tax=Knufia obscura TaxID=1635080 RepID=A0ABR0S425_9EURO|nr:hypothetical protein PMZ80_001392 [Knufia obscura]